MTKKITILGSGAFGSALAQALTLGGCQVMLWGRELPGPTYQVPGQAGQAAFLTTSLQEAMAFSSTFIVAISAQWVGSVVDSLVSNLSSYTSLCILASKGIQQGTGLLLSEVAAKSLPSCDLAVIGGPNLASEILMGHPCGLTVSAQDKEVRERVAEYFLGTSFIMDESEDIISVQVAGALKNVMAIGYGLLQQTTDSENFLASFLVLALHEMITFAKSLGGKETSFFRFAGIGDLLLSCHSQHGRNSCFGREFSGKPPMDPSTEHSTEKLIEGVSTMKAVLVRGQNLDLPLMRGIQKVLEGHLSVASWPSYVAGLLAGLLPGCP